MTAHAHQDSPLPLTGNVLWLRMLDCMPTQGQLRDPDRLQDEVAQCVKANPGVLEAVVDTLGGQLTDLSRAETETLWGWIVHKRPGLCRKFLAGVMPEGEDTHAHWHKLEQLYAMPLSTDCDVAVDALVEVATRHDPQVAMDQKELMVVSALEMGLVAPQDFKAMKIIDLLLGKHGMAGVTYEEGNVAHTNIVGVLLHCMYVHAGFDAAPSTRQEFRQGAAALLAKLLDYGASLSFPSQVVDEAVERRMKDALALACWLNDQSVEHGAGDGSAGIELMLDAGLDWRAIVAPHQRPSNATMAALGRHPRVKAAQLGEMADQVRPDIQAQTRGGPKL